MALRDFLNIVNGITVNKVISTNDGMGGFSSTVISTIIPLAAIWQNGSNNRWLSDKYAKDSTHQLVFETGAYIFNSVVTGSTVIETITYNNQLYKTIGFCDDVMSLGEISVQALERQS
jgi:hypothetical protein